MPYLYGAASPYYGAAYGAYGGYPYAGAYGAYGAYPYASYSSYPYAGAYYGAGYGYGGYAGGYAARGYGYSTAGNAFFPNRNYTRAVLMAALFCVVLNH